MIRARLALLAVLAGFATSTAGAGCDCGNKKPAAKNEPASDDDGEVAGAPDRDRPRPRMPDRRPTRDLQGRARRNAPLTVEDGVRAMPKLDARSLGEPALSPNGSQVRFNYCVDAEDIASAAHSLVASLEAAKWDKVTSRAPSGATTSARHGIAAEKGDMRLSITVQAVRRSGCDATVNQFFAVAAMNRIAADTEPPQSPSPEPEP